jgi:FAD/FMN-containing dehydrogenase
VVAGNGELLELNRGLVKNSSGYDFRQLLVGSEGTLGIVVEATLKLTDPPPPSQVMLLALPDMDALMQVFALFRARLALQAFEFFTDHALRHVLAHGAQRAIDGDYPYYVVTEFDAADDRKQEAALAAFEQALEQDWVSDGVIAQSEAQAAALWRLREGITESLAPRRPYKNDISVRVGAVPAFLHEMQALLAREYPQAEVVWFGHIGDGNLHINVLRPDDLAEAAFIEQCEHVTHLLADTLQRHGGSISAEHGIGLVKRAYLDSTRSAAEIALMRGVRKVFDPRGILNPGKLFADD